MTTRGFFKVTSLPSKRCEPISSSQFPYRNLSA
jgi:hypothetical protein